MVNLRPLLQYTSLHILNSLIFPLDTAKNTDWTQWCTRIIDKGSSCSSQRTVCHRVGWPAYWFVKIRERRMTGGRGEWREEDRRRETGRAGTVSNLTKEREETGRGRRSARKPEISWHTAVRQGPCLCCYTFHSREDLRDNISVLTSLWRNTATKQRHRREKRGNFWKNCVDVSLMTCRQEKRRIGGKRNVTMAKGRRKVWKILQNKTCIIIDQSQLISFSLPLSSLLLLLLLHCF